MSQTMQRLCQEAKDAIYQGVDMAQVMICSYVGLKGTG